MISISKNRNFLLFFSGIIFIKIFCMCVFSSDYENKMFIPFVQSFTSGTSHGNPYSYYFTNNMPESFPYPPVMLLILAPFAALAGLFNNTIIANFIFKLPLLAADIFCFLILLFFCNKRKKFICLIYFASPIILYSTFMHSQLDIIPTTLLMAALYFLCFGGKSRKILFVIFFSFAVLSKSHVLLIAPICFLFAVRKYGIVSALKYSLLFVSIIVIFVLPFYGSGFINTVVFNEEQSQLFNSIVFSPYKEMLLPACMMVLAYIAYYIINNISYKFLVLYTGVAFGLLLISVDAMPGWFIWIFPFLSMLITETNANKERNIAVLYLFSAGYLLYFIFIRKSDIIDLYFLNMAFPKINLSENIHKSIYTILNCLLMVIVYIMWNHLKAFKNSCFAIAISGDSGSGKTVLLESIARLFGIRNVLSLEGDGDHKWERGDTNYEQFNHLNPKANFLHKQSLDISLLKNGQRIMRTEYNHDTGKFESPGQIKPKPFIILSGLHTLFLPLHREKADLKIFMDTDPKLQHFWKMQRDASIRGHSIKEIKKQIFDRTPDALKYIRPQREFADLIIRYFDNGIPDEFDPAYIPVLSCELLVSVKYDMEPVLSLLEKYHIFVQHSYIDDIRYQLLLLNNKDLMLLNNTNFNIIAANIIEDLYDLTEGDFSIDPIQVFIQIVLLFIVTQTRRYKNI